MTEHPSMKIKGFLRFTLASACLWAALSPNLQAKDDVPGYVDFGKFSPPASGGEFVEVHIQNNLISMAARLAEKSEPEIAEVLRGLQLVRVNVIGLKDDNRSEIVDRIESIRDRLDEQGWERIVTAQEKNEDVRVFVKTKDQDTIQGVVVTVLEANRQAVLVNIVGNIQPEKIALIGERFHLDLLKKLNLKAQP
jgi:Domain of unknown function (DUF4252)